MWCPITSVHWLGKACLILLLFAMPTHLPQHKSVKLGLYHFMHGTLEAHYWKCGRREEEKNRFKMYGSRG